MVHTRSISQLLRAITLAAAAVAMTSATVECSKDGGNQPTSGFAVTPLSSCATGATYQGNTWDRTPYAQLNVTPYGYGVRDFQPGPQPIQNQGFCGCGAGTQPMCDEQYGVVCMPVEILSGQDIALWQPGPQGLNFSGYAGYTAYGNISDPRARHHMHTPHPYENRYAQQQVQAPQQCASHIGQTCTAGTNSCDQGSYCRPIAPNLLLGICAR